jgi:5-methylcytosine-specific restriction endonuclease McrA
MTSRDQHLPDDLHDLVASARRDRERRNEGYRARALQLFPPVCARCGRDFAGRRLRELTVHHKDHNHGNNPNDGSNWELLCLYCHEDEHDRQAAAAADDAGGEAPAPGTYQPFAGLEDLLKRPK